MEHTPYILVTQIWKEVTSKVDFRNSFCLLYWEMSYLCYKSIQYEQKHFFVLFLLISNLVSGQDLKLWYSQPAQNWSEALPIGNSRLGAMIYGGIEREELQLNEETFWAGSPYNNNNPNAVHVLPVVRKLILKGETRKRKDSLTPTS